MSIEQFKKKYKAVVIKLHGEPTRIVFQYRCHTVIIKLYDFFFNQEFIITVDYDYIEYKFNSFSDIEYSINDIINNCRQKIII